MPNHESWGRYPRVKQEVHHLHWLHDELPVRNGTTLLPYGQGRSYGDCCLNDGGIVLSTSKLDRLISFDVEKGILRCEAGVTIEEIIKFSIPRGWFLPVSPGTKYVSIGGAVANDVHGKNHHCDGTFGRHVLSFELLRSDGERLICSPKQNSELFSATIAGLGLTGLILWVEFQLKPVEGSYIDTESIKFSNLSEFFEISSDSDKDYEYTVAWLDCVAAGDMLGRGIFMRGSHSADTRADLPRKPLGGLIGVPFDAPGFILNKWTVKAFNILYYNKQREKFIKKKQHFDPFFYPLDSVSHWNRIYGKRGFFQFQCVVSSKDDNKATREIITSVVESGRASFLAVMKEFGDIESPGMISFPREGVTLCLDFPNHGQKTLKLMADLDGLVREHSGAMYPAKDACMLPESFCMYYPRWKEFKEYIDPAFSSSLWRRVMEEKKK